VLLKVLSASSVLMLLGLSFGAARVIPANSSAHVALMVGTMVSVLPLAIAIGSLLFVVTDYEVDARELRVQRLLWQTRISLTDLQRVSPEPDLLKGSIRVVGNGGMFSFSGLFYRRGLGRYRAFITDWKKSVVLSTGTRIIVISPADPAAFIHTIRLLYPAIKKSAESITRS
jgi:hypothetical protein